MKAMPVSPHPQPLSRLRERGASRVGFATFTLTPGAHAPRLPGLIPALGLLLLALAWLALGSGAVPIPPAHTLAILADRIGLALPWSFEDMERTVVLELRAPRVLLAMAGGALLALTGAAMQGLFRNPLADPGLIGVSAGAAVGAASAIVLGGALATGAWRLILLPAGAFAGGVAAALAVYALATRAGHTRLTTLLLAGIAVNALAGALLGLFAYFADDAQLRNLSFWNLGSLGGASWPVAGVAVGALALAWWFIGRRAADLDVLLLGEAQAASLGLPVQRMKILLLLLTAACVGAFTAFVGVIGFIGLVAPHMARLLIGPAHARLLPAAALMGAILTVAADWVARIGIPPAELPIGVLTALGGAPFFLWLLRKGHSR